MEHNNEILLNANEVTGAHSNVLGPAYEFVLDSNLSLIECVKIESILHGVVRTISNPAEELNGLLFELNHVRVNPELDNSYIINRLTQAFQDIGVKVHDRPDFDDVEVCFKPLGEMSDIVRFYVSQNQNLVFLSPSARKRLTCY